MSETLSQRCDAAYHTLLEAIDGVTDEEAAAFSVPNWPQHDGTLGEDGSIAAFIWHCAGWKELWAIYFETGVDAERAALHPAEDTWAGRRHWLAQSHARLMNHLSQYDGRDEVELHGKTLRLEDYDITNGEHDTYHAAQIWHLRARFEAAAKSPSTTIAPMLSVRRGAEAIEFYKAAFAAQEVFRIDDDNGAVVARLSVGSAEFWVADESPEHQNFSPETIGGGSVRMVMVVEDPDAAFNQAIAAGATVVVPVANEYGWRLGRIVDPYGHHWEIGKPLPGTP